MDNVVGRNFYLWPRVIFVTLCWHLTYESDLDFEGMGLRVAHETFYNEHL